MSEEELKKTIDIVASIEIHSETEAIAKEKLMSYVEQLHQEKNNGGDIMNDFDIERKKALISKIKKCDSLHDNCDYLLEHNECDDIVEYIELLQQENNKLKAELELYRGTLHENHKLVNLLNDYEDWLENEKKRINDLMNPKKGIQPYGEELNLLQNSKNVYFYAKERLIQMREGVNNE